MFFDPAWRASTIGSQRPGSSGLREGEGGTGLPRGGLLTCQSHASYGRTRRTRSPPHGSRLGARAGRAHAVTRVMGDRENRLWFEAARHRAGSPPPAAPRAPGDEGRHRRGPPRDAPLSQALEGRRISELACRRERTILLSRRRPSRPLSGVPPDRREAHLSPRWERARARPLPQPDLDRERLWAASTATNPSWSLQRRSRVATMPICRGFGRDPGTVLLPAEPAWSRTRPRTDAGALLRPCGQSVRESQGDLRRFGASHAD
jgi:hypothetical protein